VGLWSRLLCWRSHPATEEPVEEPDTEETSAGDEPVLTLPSEPFVFECQSCGKVFEARRKRPPCPECDSADVSLMSE
jgi:Zn finger protein HypA/HybF involved in hydrogenase expression